MMEGRRWRETFRGGGGGGGLAVVVEARVRWLRTGAEGESLVFGTGAVLARIRLKQLIVAVFVCLGGLGNREEAGRRNSWPSW